jgi:hypothetical protein
MMCADRRNSLCYQSFLAFLEAAKLFRTGFDEEFVLRVAAELTPSAGR